jgi:hypothetical protein
MSAVRSVQVAPGQDPPVSAVLWTVMVDACTGRAALNVAKPIKDNNTGMNAMRQSVLERVIEIFFSNYKKFSNGSDFNRFLINQQS